jgi:hypothetical protein
LEVDSSDGPGALAFPPGCGTETLPPGAVLPGPGLPLHLMILATEQNAITPGLRGADMVYYPHPGGGFVFSAGSITFGSSLAIDPALQQIMVNALAEACGPGLTLHAPWIPTASTTMEIEVHGRFGAEYMLQGSGTLSVQDWEDEQTFLLNSNVLQTITVPLTGERRFFRVKQLP